MEFGLGTGNPKSRKKVACGGGFCVFYIGLKIMLLSQIVSSMDSQLCAGFAVQEGEIYTNFKS